MSEKRRLEVEIETDGQYCGQECPMGDSGGSSDCCLGVICEFDWSVSKNRRTSFCTANAKEAMNGND